MRFVIDKILDPLTFRGLGHVLFDRLLFSCDDSDDLHSTRVFMQSRKLSFGHVYFLTGSLHSKVFFGAETFFLYLKKNQPWISCVCVFTFNLGDDFSNYNHAQILSRFLISHYCYFLYKCMLFINLLYYGIIYVVIWWILILFIYTFSLLTYFLFALP